MKVGDLVKLKGVHHPTRRRLGIVVRDFTIPQTNPTRHESRLGEVEVLWNDGTTANARYANLGGDK